MKKFIHRDDIGDFEIPEIKIIDGKRFYVTPDGNSYPSITTILSLQEKPGIDKWKEKVPMEGSKMNNRTLLVLAVWSAFLIAVIWWLSSV